MVDGDHLRGPKRKDHETPYPGQSIRSGMIKADDLLSVQPLTFRESGLLACHPIMTTAKGQGISVLTDFQRKVMRILYNYNSGRRRFPTIHKLTVKTGNEEKIVMAALNVLITAEYIHWDNKFDTANIVILEGWEREIEQPKPPAAPQFDRSCDISYWTEY